MTGKESVTRRYQVTWGYRENSYTTLDEVVLFISTNHLEAFSVLHDGTDLTDAVRQCVSWKQGNKYERGKIK